MTQKYIAAKVMGLQRTGTNWISSLIKLNFNVPELERLFWKHKTIPYPTKYPYFNLLHGLDIKKDDISPVFKYSQVAHAADVFYILVSKDYDLWMESIDRNAVDVYMTHQGINGRHDLKKLHDAWMATKDALSEKDNVYYRRYEDWYVNWKEYLEEIEQLTGWERKHDEFLDTKDVSMSPNFDRDNYKDLK